MPGVCFMRYYFLNKHHSFIWDDSNSSSLFWAFRSLQETNKCTWGFHHHALCGEIISNHVRDIKVNHSLPLLSLLTCHFVYVQRVKKKNLKRLKYMFKMLPTEKKAWKANISVKVYPIHIMPTALYYWYYFREIQWYYIYTISRLSGGICGMEIEV